MADPPHGRRARGEQRHRRERGSHVGQIGQIGVDPGKRSASLDLDRGRPAIDPAAHLFQEAEQSEISLARAVGDSTHADSAPSDGGGGEEIRMVCGFIESSEFLFAPVFRSLPALLVERTPEHKVDALITSTVREIVTRVEAATPGTEAVLGRLMELLFVELLRRHIARLPTGSKGWFAALNDPVVGRALQLLHSEPARRWTIDEIASRAGSSRTVVSDRFKALLGRPPIDYLASWRIQLAAERLRVGHESIPNIAASVGYDSEAAFNRAFKRITGMTPGSWRTANVSSH